MSAVTGDPRGLFKFPVLTPKSKVIVKAEVADDLNRVWESHIAGEREVLAVLGPTGTAKTSLAFNLAAIHNIPIMTFDAVGAREFSDWVGTTHLRGDQTVFVPSGFLTAVDADGPYGGQFRIVLVDEVNRAESTGALNALIPMLHDYLSLYVPELNRAVAIDPAVMFVLTANRGSQYGGTIGLDAAFVDRVTSWVRMDYLEKDAEKDLVVARTGLDGQQADRLCLAAQRVREAAQRGELPEGGGISTRRILIAAGKAVRGMSLHRAASLAWMGSYPDEGGSTSESTVVKSAIDAVLRGL
jgi:MoxR-like ATPase